MPDFSIGVDLGGTNLRIAAVSDEGHLLEKVTLGTKVAMGRDHVLNEMCDAIQRLSAKYRGSGATFLGAGIGIPGEFEAVVCSVAHQLGTSSPAEQYATTIDRNRLR